METFGFTLLFGLALGVLGAVAYWLWHDAQRRGKPGWLVVLVVGLATFPVGILAWLAFRPSINRPARRGPIDYSRYDW